MRQLQQCWKQKAPGGVESQVLVLAGLCSPGDPGWLLSPPFSSLFLFVKPEIYSTSPKTFLILGLCANETVSSLFLQEKEERYSGKQAGACWECLHPVVCSSFLCPERLSGPFSTSNPLFGSFSPRRKWPPTPVFLPGESHGQGSLVGCGPWCGKESDMSERLNTQATLLS